MYESVPKTQLMKRTPVIIRLDGKAFHTFTRGLNKPFDKIMVNTMIDTTYELCKNIQGCVFGYTQSDEITLVLVDYKKLTSSAWFDYEVQKMCSIAASMATMAFNKAFAYNLFIVAGLDNDLLEVYRKAVEKGAMFDARCFNVPKEEVTNFVYWRQLDATRNSIQMAGQAKFSQKQLQGKSCNTIQDMLFTEKGINWNNYPTYMKRGSACINTNNGWLIDKDMPILKDAGRDYVDKLIYVGEN
jgi:tRNA(His) 5'-end guanylyltransferase